MFLFTSVLFLFLVSHKVVYATNPLSYITRTTMDDTIDIDGVTYLRNYKVTTTHVSSTCNSPTDHYCPQNSYPNLKAEGSKIKTYSRCRRDVACSGSGCTPRCGWLDLIGCDSADVYTCASDYFPVAVNGDREAWCVKLAPVPPAVTYAEVMKVQCPSGEVRIAGVKNGTSPLKIQKSDGTYGIVLVDPLPLTDEQSCMRIRVSDGAGGLVTKALRKCDPTVTASCT